MMDWGAMDDKNWKKEEVKHRMKQYIKLWEKMQKDMTYMTSSVSYVELKEQKVRRQKEVVEGVKEERDINTFIVINSYDNHHTDIVLSWNTYRCLKRQLRLCLLQKLTLVIEGTTLRTTI